MLCHAQPARTMTIILNIPSEVEAQLRREAEKAGLDADKYVVKALREQLLHRSQEADSCPPKTEAELLQKINLGLSQEAWQRYHQLIDKRRAATLTADEQQELIAFSDQIEKANAERIELLVELARQRQTSLEAVMKELGIEAPPYG